ncbi:glutathione S-transferase T3-like [Arabidopsis lyrata subsp. lyrata]|nr:glutathione S-transferase T3-like [Arabidopsis lyrata subsp. lyrata]|eukprot:XP_020881652.1 glutathione S-transferase T3-like [Arabidopsis lyrata subsp. lyrata]
MDPNNTPNSQSQPYFSLLNFPYDGYAPNVNIGSSQIPSFSSQTSSQPTQPPTQPEETAEQRRERRIWSTEDDLVLISGWLNTSKDAIVGNDQRSGSFWKRISEYYGSSTHGLGGAEPRLPDHCRQRWQKVSRHNAHQIYTKIYKKKFALEYAWNVLRYEQKWLNLEAMNPTPNKSTSSNKRKANDAAPSSGSVVGEHESRPPGIKAMKKLRKTKGKEKASASAAPSAASATPSAEFSKMFELKQKDVEGMKELQKLSILDSLIAKKENLDEEDKIVKKKLVAELFLT